LNRISKALLQAAIILSLESFCIAQTNLPSATDRTSAGHIVTDLPIPDEPIEASTISPEQQPSTTTTAPVLSTGIISGTILDQTGAVRVGARIRLSRGDQLLQEVLSGDNGQFSFSKVPPGSFGLMITSVGFVTQRTSGTLEPGQTVIIPAIMLAVAGAVTEVQVGLSSVEVAQAQVKEQEKQRVLGFIPNFYVSYLPNAAPLTTKLKFELAWRSSVDPVTFLGVAALAGMTHAANQFDDYGQGAQGYAKRFSALYVDDFVGTFIGSAMLPSLLKQDPRYFYQGTGSVQSRLLHAVSNSVICRGDNGRLQPNYSSIFGSLAAGGISYLYYPSSERSGPALFFTNAAIKAGENSIAGIFQEFVIPRFTPRYRRRHQNKPAASGK